LCFRSTFFVSSDEILILQVTNLQPWSLSTIMLLWHSFLIIIIIIIIKKFKFNLLKKKNNNNNNNNNKTNSCYNIFTCLLKGGNYVRKLYTHRTFTVAYKWWYQSHLRGVTSVQHAGRARPSFHVAYTQPFTGITDNTNSRRDTACRTPLLWQGTMTFLPRTSPLGQFPSPPRTFPGC